MAPLTGSRFDNLPEAVGRGLSDFIGFAQAAFGADLRSVVLYGSAAEGRMRATSDVNVLLVLAAFDRAKADAFRPAFVVAHAAIKLRAMFLLETEVQPAADAFAQKFADILRRRKVLLGPDPFEGVSVRRAALLARLGQVLLNLTLRLREAYVTHGTYPEQMARVVADASGPLRTSAAALLELEGSGVMHPKEALEKLARSFSGKDWSAVLKNISQVRETGLLTADEAEATLAAVIELAERMRSRVAAIS